MKKIKQLLAKLIFLLACAVILPPLIAHADTTGLDPVNPDGSLSSNQYFKRITTMFNDGTSVEQNIINGPPTPPPGFERATVRLPEPNHASGVKTLVVPAYDWVFGCTAVSAAMIAGYYDRNGFPDMYTGSTNSGVMPLDSSTWGTWSDGTKTYPLNPLVASRNGLDGRSTRGSLDDYWVEYNSSAQDPYTTNGWTQHTWGDAIGDYMKTSQSACGNVDGSTLYYTLTGTAYPYTCSAMGTEAKEKDGTYGRKLFYEAKGYTVNDCYNQKTDNVISGGFSFAQYKAEIDAGHPVLLQLKGHSIVGVGYDDSVTTDNVYIHDTWDYQTHTMTWGSWYSDSTMTLDAVCIIHPQVGGAATTTTIPTTTTTSVVPANLTPYQPTGWTDKIVVSKVAGANSDDTGFSTADTLYVDFAALNDSAGDISTSFSCLLLLDDVEVQSWQKDSLVAGHYAYIEDYSVGTLSAGTHTLTLKADSTNTIAESNESDNVYEKSISVAKRGLCSAEKVLGEDNPALDSLRIFRDSTLAQSAVGRKLIQIYYNNTDSINAVLERNPALGAMSRRVLEALAPVIGREEN